jgi:hypothetical protein
VSSILVIVPSRSRPANIVRFVSAFAVTRTSGADLLVVVDDDDPCLLDYQAIALTPGRSWFRLEAQPPRRLGPTLNYWSAGQPNYDIIGFAGDDHIMRTKHWDLCVAQALRTRPGVAYGNDLLQGPNLPTAAFISTVLIDALGYMVPRGLIHMYLDNFWKELGMNLDALTYFNDVVIEHMHFLNGKAELDEGYKRVNAREMYAHDKRVFENYMRFDFKAALERCMAVIGAHP